MVPLFHLALPVVDLKSTRTFYCGLLGCAEGRSAERWVDVDFFGHQLSFHVVPGRAGIVGRNPVDGDAVPIPHFGAILPWEDFWALAERLRVHGADFVISPRIRFEGQVGEQATMFILDPSDNALEFKSFKDPSRVFATAIDTPGAAGHPHAADERE